jgi:uncharacterized protein involved in response to NO
VSFAVLKKMDLLRQTLPVPPIGMDEPKRVSPSALAQEPFRIFFPAGVVAGIIGVMLWPLYFWGILQSYPGQNHARIMAYGLFGGFILGFLGTAMPRMLSAFPFRFAEVLPILLLHLAMVLSYAAAHTSLGDTLLLLLLFTFFICIAIRARYRKDTPPPGFVLVGLSFLCMATGAILSIVADLREIDPYWISLQRLLSYQGFVLLPILGIGPFILPRFFGMQSHHDFPEALVPVGGWWKKAALALAAGALIITSFFLETAGWYRLGYTVRFATTLAYLLLEMPFHRAPKASNALGLSVRIAFGGILAGFLAVALFPIYRIALLHLTLIGGFAVITFVVATRVVFGHSGNIELVKKRNRWLLIAIGIMLFAMVTRISGDFWPKIMASHYSYGAILWVMGVIIWAAYVLPKVLSVEEE